MNDKKYIIKSGVTQIAALSEKGYEQIPNHKYIKSLEAPKKGLISVLNKNIIEHYSGSQKSTKSWRKDRNQFYVTWATKNGNEKISSPINYLIIGKHLRENQGFFPSKLGLPDIECFWLDKSVDVSINFHKSELQKGNALTIKDGTPQVQFGDAYPIKPNLDREGHFFTTLQPQLINRVIKNRNKLIKTSDEALHYDWVMDLRTLINDVISVLEITLTQVYIKAQYSPLEHWDFDFKKLGNKNGRRLMDKLKWIRLISGKNLDIENEAKSLDNLREIRNHFNHFDPPSLVVTLEEAATWLNQVLDIGVILYKIRCTLNVETSTHLINYLLQPEVVFHPEEAFKNNRLPLDGQKTGYKSSTWNE